VSCVFEDSDLCINCDIGCRTCMDSSDNCLSCIGELGYYLEDSTCLWCDVSGYYLFTGDTCISIMQFEGENWSLVRRNAQPTNWHPTTDNAKGTHESYSIDGYNIDPTGPHTFNK
jgi:hypothetical protein